MRSPAKADNDWRDLFRQPWWLDAVAPDSWQEVAVRADGRTRAHLAFAVTTRHGRLVHLGMPSLTPRLGPWIDPGEGSHARRLGRERELLDELVEQLPRFDYFSQDCQPSFTNWLPLSWRGFEQTTRYTYAIEDLQDVDAVWRGLLDKTRNSVRRGQERLKVRLDLGADQLFDLVQATFDRQGVANPLDRQVVRRIHDRVLERDAGQPLFAVDPMGKVHAALLLVWDSRRAYYLLGGADESLRSSGAMSVLLWEAITLASKTSQAFDFEGSMIQPLERFFRGFGAHQTPYFRISKSSRRMAALLGARQIGRAVTGRS
jgi:hypothetical protein